MIRTHVRLQLPYAVAADYWSFGTIVGREDDVTAAPIAPPANGSLSPSGQPELDWSYLDLQNAVETGATIDGVREQLIDLKSRRKVDEMGQTYLLVVQNNTATAAPTIRYFAHTLLMLP